MKSCEHGQRYDRLLGLDGLVAERVALDGAGVLVVYLATGVGGRDAARSAGIGRRG